MSAPCCGETFSAAPVRLAAGLVLNLGDRSVLNWFLSAAAEDWFVFVQSRPVGGTEPGACPGGRELERDVVERPGA